MNKLYTLPKLSFDYQDLAPFISEAQLTLHHQKHHQAYVNGANSILEKLEKARGENADLDMKATLRELSFHIGGHILHSLFWENLAPASKGGGGAPKGKLFTQVEENFGSFERFKKEFTQTAISVEGSGWAALILEPQSQRLLLAQIEKHNLFSYPNCQILLVLDVWEHAYYLDHKNERAKFVEAFWNIINWQEVSRRVK